MSSRSPYGPDLSLLIAAVVLIGGCLLAAATVYLLSTSAGTVTDWHRTRLAEAQAQKEARSTAHRSARRPAPTARSRRSSRGARSSSPPFGRVPTWTGSELPAPPPEAPSPETYDLRPDMSHADLGMPSDAPNSGLIGSGASRREPEPPTSGGPSAGNTPLTVDLGTESPSEQTGWQSDASTLGRRARALSGALAHLDRANKSANETSRAGRNPASGNASTASANRGPHATTDPPLPPDDPPQVPVDGGLGWLAAAGAAYAANRLRKSQDANESGDEA